MPNWLGGGQGAVGGAMTGAALGSVVPGLGTAAGGIIGGGLGLLGGLFGDQQNPYEQQLAGMVGRPAPQLGAAHLGQNSGFRRNQQDLVKMLEAQSRGEGPSLAVEAANQQADRGARQAEAQAASMRGPNAGLGAFQAMNMAGDAQNAATQAAALGRIQEQYNAQNLLGLTLHGARGADEDMSRFNAGQMNDRDRVNLEAQLQRMGLDANILSSLYGGKANQTTMGEQLLASGAGSLGFLAAQKGANQPGAAPMQAPQGPQFGGFGGAAVQAHRGAHQGYMGNPGAGRQAPQLVDPWGPGNEWASLYGTNPWNWPGV